MIDHELELQDELSKREMARRYFRDFCKYWIESTRSPFLWNWHWDYLCDVLQAVEAFDPEVRFLIINMPPRFAKSTLTAVLWHAWCIGRNDNATSSMFSLTSSGNFAARDSRRTMEIVESEWYQALFPKVKLGAKATEAEWYTTGGSYRLATGAEGSVTGRGAHRILCIAKGSIISTKRGKIPIESIVVGDMAATPNGWKRISGSKCTGLKECVTLRTELLALTLTSNHRCSTPQGWQQSGCLSKGDIIHAAHSWESSGDVRPVPQSITSKTESGIKEVYDLSVDDAHCFYANDILVHNCDDLIQADEAGSETIREKRNEWLGETMRSRLDDQKRGTITVIQQRLHERDSTGYLLELAKRPGGDQYKQICLPNEAVVKTIVSFKDKVYARREPGDLLHEARIGKAETLALRTSMRSNYEGQYQQNPTKMEGGHLDPRRLVRLPHSALDLKSRLGLHVAFYLDFAATEKQTQKDDPDYNVILVGAKDQLNRLILLDVWRQQAADQGIVARTLINMHKLWRPVFVKGERGALLNTLQPVLRSQQQLVGHFFALTPLPGRRQDKVERNLSFQGMLNAGMVCVPDGAPWLPACEAEMRGFPKSGSHDDVCDTFSDLANDYVILPVGGAPPTDPADDKVRLNQTYIKAINQAIANEKNPPTENDGWG